MRKAYLDRTALIKKSVVDYAARHGIDISTQTKYNLLRLKLNIEARKQGKHRCQFCGLLPLPDVNKETHDLSHRLQSAGAGEVTLPTRRGRR